MHPVVTDREQASPLARRTAEVVAPSRRRYVSIYVGAEGVARASLFAVTWNRTLTFDSVSRKVKALSGFSGISFTQAS